MSNAGYSARVMARQASWAANPLRIYGPNLAAVVVLTGLFLLTPAPPAWVVMGALTIALWQYVSLWRRHGDQIQENRAKARRYRTGARTERSTARHLWPLTWFGRYRVFHDRRVPDSKANFDHIVVGRSGVWHVDTKSRLKQWNLQGDKLYYDGSVIDTSTTHWETSELQKALKRKFGHDIPVRTVWAVHGRPLPVPIWNANGVSLINVKSLNELIRRQNRRMSKQEANAVAEFISKKFPPAS